MYPSTWAVDDLLRLIDWLSRVLRSHLVFFWLFLYFSQKMAGFSSSRRKTCKTFNIWLVKILLPKQINDNREAIANTNEKTHRFCILAEYAPRHFRCWKMFQEEKKEENFLQSSKKLLQGKIANWEGYEKTQDQLNTEKIGVSFFTLVLAISQSLHFWSGTASKLYPPVKRTSLSPVAMIYIILEICFCPWIQADISIYYKYAFTYGEICGQHINNIFHRVYPHSFFWARCV